MKKLTHYQRRTLEFYLANKNKDITLIDVWLFNAGRYILNFALYAVFVLLVYALGGSEPALLAMFAFGGAYLRDLVIPMITVRNWAMLKEITDWEKASSLLNSGTPNPS